MVAGFQRQTLREREREIVHEQARKKLYPFYDLIPRDPIVRFHSVTLAMLH